MAKIKYGNIEIPDEAFEPKNTKVRITTFVDGDIVQALRKRAKDQGIGYQTLLNQVLRRIIESPMADADTKSERRAEAITLLIQSESSLVGDLVLERLKDITKRPRRSSGQKIYPSKSQISPQASGRGTKRKAEL